MKKTIPVKTLLAKSIPLNWFIHAFQGKVYELRHVYLGAGILYSLHNPDVLKCFYRSPLVRAFHAFIGVLLLSSLTTFRGWQGVFEMWVWSLYMLAGYAAVRVDREATLRTFALLPLSLGAMFIGGELWDALSGAYPTASWRPDRLIMLMKTPSRLGTVGAICSLYFTSLALRADNMRERLFPAAVSIVSLGLVYLTYSRSALFACLLLLVLLFAVIRKQWKMLFYGAAALGVFGFLAVFIWGGANDGGNSPTRLVRVLTDPLGDREIQARIAIWYVAWKNFLAHPLLGMGFSQFEGVYRGYLAAHPEIFDMFAVVNDSHTQAHNMVLELLSGSGVLGLLTFGIFYVKMLRAAWRNPEHRYTTMFFLLYYLMEGLTGAVLNRYLFITLIAPFLGMLIHDEQLRSGEMQPHQMG